MITTANFTIFQINTAAAKLYELVINGLYVGVQCDQSLHHGRVSTPGCHVEKGVLAAVRREHRSKMHAREYRRRHEQQK